MSAARYIREALRCEARRAHIVGVGERHALALLSAPDDAGEIAAALHTLTAEADALAERAAWCRYRAYREGCGPCPAVWPQREPQPRDA